MESRRQDQPAREAARLPNEGCRVSKGLGREGTGLTGVSLAAFLLVAATAVLLVGCGREEPAAENEPSGPDVVPLEVESPLRAPIFSPDESSVLTLDEEARQLVRLEVEETSGGLQSSGEPLAVTEERELEGAGENLALTPAENQGLIFVPQPGLGRVQAIEDDDLLDVRTFDAGESPARVALGGSSIGQSSPTLFALSDDGSTVTAVNVEDYGKVGEAEIGGSEDTLLEAPPTGDGRAFWTAGPEGVALHELGSTQRDAEALNLSAAALTADPQDAQRAYVSETGTGRVVAVEADGVRDLETVAETDLGEEVTSLIAEGGRLYATTRNRLVVLDAENLEAVEAVELETEAVREALSSAEPSGLAVGAENFYVTLRGEPYVLSITKP